jgi:hypothetical protein
MQGHALLGGVAVYKLPKMDFSSFSNGFSFVTVTDHENYDPKKKKKHKNLKKRKKQQKKTFLNFHLSFEENTKQSIHNFQSIHHTIISYSDIKHAGASPSTATSAIQRPQTAP